MDNAQVLPVRTGYETLIADRLSGKFVKKAKDDGVITGKTKTSVTVKYKDGSKEKFSLKAWSSKEEAHATYLHPMETLFSKDDKFKKGDVIVYDSLFFEPDIFDSKSVVMKTGMVVRTQYVESQLTYEDSMAISQRMTKHMKTRMTKVKSFVINKDTQLNNLVDIKDKVNYHSPLFTMSENNEEMELMPELSKESLEVLEDFHNSSPKAKIDGEIKKIIFYYNCELKDINKKLRKVIEHYNAELEPYTGQVNSGYSVNGKSLLEGEIEMKIYIEGDLPMGVGDKGVLGNQLKCTVGDVFPNDIVSEDGRPVDMVFSTKSKDNRIVNSPDIVGSAMTALIALQDKVVKEYFGE